MRFISYFITCLLALLVVACGGGGGSPGISSGPNAALSVAAPTAITLQVGLTQQYVIQGGVKPYTVFSNNPAVAVGWLIGEDIIAVGTTSAGIATVSVQDAKGTKFDIVVTAGSSTAFSTTSPTTLSLSPKTSQTYSLAGGTAPYTATSNFPTLATVVVDGSRMTITTGDHVDGANIATISIRDSAGATQTTAVSVITTPLTVTLGTYKVFLGDTVRFIISGGTPPYRILDPLNNTVTAKIINGNEGEVTGIRVVDPVELIVVDANGQTAVAPKITFMAGGDSFLRVSPDLFTMPENHNSPNIVLNVFGVTAGSPISVFTTDNALLVPGTPVKTTADGTAYTITLAGGNTCSIVDYAAPVAAVAASVGPPPVAAVAAVPEVPSDRTVTITVLDSTGKRGTSTITVADTGTKTAATCP
ncbi:MAG: hypothetical protein ABIZ09_05995 [Rhodoferax sp.]